MALSHCRTKSVRLVLAILFALQWIHPSYADNLDMGLINSSQNAAVSNPHTPSAQVHEAIGAAVIRLEWFLAAIVLLLALFAAVFIFLNKRAKSRLTTIELQKADIERQLLREKMILEELRETKDQLVRNEKMSSLGQMTSGIAHELNNPLNFISGGIQALEANVHELARICDSQSQPKTHEIVEEIDSLLNSIHKGVTRIAGIILSLKTFSSPQADMQHLVLREPVMMALEMLQSKIKSAGVVISKNFEEPVEVIGNSSELMQVFTNLIDNAIFAMVGRDTRELNIRAFRRDRFVVVALHDTGCGIPEDIRPRITDAFFTTKPEGVGTGLGLSISKRIIEKHNGELSFTSVFGAGTTFEISLPVVNP
ncbi:MAG: sensor histidine kinase [Bacteroidota bacterium]